MRINSNLRPAGRVHPSMRLSLALLPALLLLPACSSDPEPPAPTTPPTASASAAPVPPVQEPPPPPTTGAQLRQANCPTFPEEWVSRTEIQPLVPQPGPARLCVFEQGSTARATQIDLTQTESDTLRTLINAAGQPGAAACTTELGTTYVLSFVQPDDTLSTVAVENFGCRLIRTRGKTTYVAPPEALALLVGAAARP